MRNAFRETDPSDINYTAKAKGVRNIRYNQTEGITLILSIQKALRNQLKEIKRKVLSANSTVTEVLNLVGYLIEGKGNSELQ